MSKGKIVLGAISGLLFGLFLGIDLVLLGVLESDSVVVTVLMLVGLLGGIALGVTTPFKRKNTTPAAAD